MRTLLTFSILLSTICLTALAQPTAFTYNGVLSDDGTAANGIYDLEFKIYDAETNGVSLGVVTNTATAVSNGLFTVTLNFGAGVFDGSDRWLEIGTVTNGGGAFTTLTPRQPFTSTPYAIFAAGVEAAGVSGTLSLDVVADGSIEASKFSTNLGVWTASGTDIYYTGGEVGIGWAAPQFPLHVHHGGGTPTVPANQTAIFGSSPSGYGVVGFSKGGNRAGVWGSNSGTTGPAYGVWGQSSFSGGTGVFAEGGFTGANRALHAQTHSPDGYAGYFEGGKNYFEGDVGIGTDSPAEALHVTGNILATGTIMGTIIDPGFIGTTTTAPLQFQVNNTGGLRLEYPTVGTVPNLVGGSSGNSVGAGTEAAVIAGGFFNSIGANSEYSAIGGGRDNSIASDSTSATIAGGLNNDIGANSPISAIGGGSFNTIASNAFYAVIPGGLLNLVGAGASYALAAGRKAKANHQGTFVWADSQNVDFASTGTDQFLIRASGGVGVNKTDPATALDVNGTVTAVAFSGDGSGLTGLPNGSALDAADGSPVNALFVDNSGQVGIGTTSPGAALRVQGASTLGDLWLSPTTSGGNADIFLSENISGSFGIKLRHNGSANLLEFVGVNSSAETAPLVTIGRGTTSGMTIANNLAVGGTVTATAFNPSSDRTLKENFARVSPQEVLAKVAALPISRWNFKGDNATPHVGPMAQDFHAAFGLGTDERHIATVDADGVALAAIQGLSQKLTEEVNRRDAENAELRHQLTELKELVLAMNHKLNGGAQ